jgi:hypothetical protein
MPPAGAVPEGKPTSARRALALSKDSRQPSGRRAGDSVELQQRGEEQVAEGGSLAVTPRDDPDRCDWVELGVVRRMS